MSAWTLAFAVVLLGPLLMLVGLTILFATILSRRAPSIDASRLLLFGPAVGLMGGALLAAQLPVDLALRLAVIVTSIGLALPCFVAGVRVSYPRR